MPIYEFVCKSCDNEFERIQSFSDPSTPACPNCSSDNVERQMGLPAIHFKGSGWYVNDSKKAAKESANGQPKNGADKETKSSDKSEGESAKSDEKASANASSSDSSVGSKSSVEKSGKSSAVKE